LQAALAPTAAVRSAGQGGVVVELVVLSVPVVVVVTDAVLVVVAPASSSPLTITVVFEEQAETPASAIQRTSHGRTLRAPSRRQPPRARGGRNLSALPGVMA
jgi:hypothetical protein